MGDEHMAFLSLLPKIEHLVLTGTAISDAAMQTIAALDRLAVLDVSDTSITDWGASQLAFLPSLRCLGIYGTKITDASTATIGKLSTLEMLNVSFTQITDAGLLNLVQLTNLRSIELHHTSITTDRLARFRSSLPECLVVSSANPSAH